MAVSGCGGPRSETQQGKSLQEHVLLASRPAAHQGPTTSTCSFTGYPAVQAKYCETNPNDLQRWGTMETLITVSSRRVQKGTNSARAWLPAKEETRRH